jgi:hypothetical protein
VGGSLRGQHYVRAALRNASIDQLEVASVALCDLRLLLLVPLLRAGHLARFFDLEGLADWREVVLGSGNQRTWVWALFEASRVLLETRGALPFRNP